MISLRSPLLSLALAVLAPWTSAQSGGFTPGDLIFFKPLMRIDPLTGDAVLIADWPVTYLIPGGVAYDPFRDRLITMGNPTPSTTMRLWALDSSGVATDLGFQGRAFQAFAPAVAGRIYLMDANQPTAKLRYIDAANQEHLVMDASGATPYTFPQQHNMRHMVYDQGSNALFTAHTSSSLAPCGTSLTVFVQKHPLSGDGSRVVGPVTCNSYAVGPGAATLVGLSRGPGGLLMTVDTNTVGLPEPLQLLIHADTLAIAPFALPNSGAISAGTYSQVRGQAVLLDTGADILRAFGPGDSGVGTLLPTSLPVSPAGSHSEDALLLEIPTTACGTNNVSLYCTAKTTSGGCVPKITTSGGPSVSAEEGFFVRCSAVEPNNPGILFYGKSGAQSVPFQGGFLCVKPPLLRLPGQNSGGGGACSGTFAYDFNAWIAGGSDVDLVSGSTVHAQFWFRDPVEPISGTGLSAALSFTICP